MIYLSEPTEQKSNNQFTNSNTSSFFLHHPSFSIFNQVSETDPVSKNVVFKKPKW
jgi:hypothetical protein